MPFYFTYSTSTDTFSVVAVLKMCEVVGGQGRRIIIAKLKQSILLMTGWWREMGHKSQGRRLWVGLELRGEGNAKKSNNFCTGFARTTCSVN